MASFAKCLLIATSLVIILIINPSAAAKPSPNVTNADINSICNKTLAPSFCFRVLTNQTLHANETTLFGLANISINIALASANETQFAIAPLIKQAKNFTVREAYTLCSHNYKEAAVAVRDAQRLLAKHNYRGMRISALSAVEEAKACENHIKSPAVCSHSPLHDKNRDFKRYCNIIWAISNRLVQ
ncbi:Pectinesterase inhibitor [Corchorus capsularis]|uniref:Pectinesterase inhibitor n=1 Tax=Corchorus capsularis TaxID=210143 RepID=A0A1R3JUD3_COCAP|nr:Pectinesterase inhibitor [Corchorus capsularis]